MQIGTTTRAMLEAPEGAYYVWVNRNLGYPKLLASSLGRDDLKIVGPSWLGHGRQDGMHRENIVVDHAMDLHGGQLKILDRMGAMEEAIQESDVEKMENNL